MRKKSERVCEFCGRGSSRGNSITRRGKAKKLGGVGRKITGITPRTFRPNLQRIRIRQGGRVVRARICTSCLKRGVVQKAVH